MSQFHRMPIGGTASMSKQEKGVDASQTSSDTPPSKAMSKRIKKKQQKKRKRMLSDAVQSIPDMAEADLAEKKRAKDEDANIDDEGSPPGHVTLNGAGSLATDSDISKTAVYTGRSPSEVFAWMIYPITPQEFFRDYWEKKPLLIKRKKKKFYKDVFTAQILDHVLRNNNVKFGVNLDVTTYQDGVRQTHNIPGRAHPGTLWQFYDEGCSVRTLHPQAYHPPLWQLVSSLQEYFQCMVGVNTYLTPPGTQGFSPHYDDIEAFILQTEGSKRWRLYENPTGEKLPRFSSSNFDQSEIGKPIMETILNAGDMLYFPRGIVHQANALESELSHHVTISTYQLNTWGNLMEKMITGALESAYEDIHFREGLPMNYLDYMGVINEDRNEDDPRRKAFIKKVSKLFDILGKSAPIDAAVDQVATSYIHSCMPTVVAPNETQYSAKFREAGPNKRFIITGETDVRLVSKNVARLVIEGDSANLYHTCDNGMIYKSEEPQLVTFDLGLAEAVEYLLKNYDDWKPVCTIPAEDMEDRTMIASCLYDVGVLLARE